MAKAPRTSNSGDIRIFRTELGSELAELADIGFGDEGQLHELIESNIGTLFQDLAFLRREFRDLDGGRHIPDTVAFDKGQNTFVVIEYKNKLDKGVIDQAKAYLKYMKKNKHALVMEYSKSEGGGPSDLKSYNWNVYAIIMAPEFTQNQIDGAEEEQSLELYEIRRYDADVLTARRVSGGHGRTRTAAPSSQPKRQVPLTSAAVKRHGSVPDASKSPAAPRLNMDSAVALPDIEYVKGVNPRELTCPDGSRVSLERWTGILAGIADWLVSKGYLGELHCPVPIGRNNAILNTQPIHQNGRGFRRFREAGQLYVCLNVSPSYAIRHSIKLIGTAGLNPSDFKVYFGDSAWPTKPKTSPLPMLARVAIAKGSSIPGCEETDEGCFIPSTVTIGVGGEVTWVNDDAAAHTVTSGVLADGGSDGIFDSGLLGPGAEFSHRFEAAGEYHYFDLVHPWMQGIVIVME